MSSPARWRGGLAYLLLGALLVAALVATRSSSTRVPGGAVAHLSRDPAGVMGTECRLRIAAGRGQEAAAEQALDRAEAALRRVEALMSVWLEDSEISRLNRAAAGDTIRLSAETIHLLSLSRRFALETRGVFDVTCGPLIEVWRLAGRRGLRPSPGEIEAARAASSWDGLALVEAGAVKTGATTRVDLGGIAKGYAIDLAVDAMRAAGLAGGLVEVGGDLRCFGRGPEAGRWRIEIRNPFADETWGALSLSDRAVCTSGDYARFATIEGVRYSHIVDPRTGQPAGALPSVTVAAADAATADVWATALSVLGAEGIDLIDPGSGIEALMILGTAESFSVVMTPGFEALLGERPAE
ncbi:MAG: FAD:protein FMN transferase [Candidatus Eisenbacteria bacterium]|uniref:FAD:protein FMN transferase n=1 Tax=Eiseniibacteriota bacterium TaxID=2212470 RepID=A0A937XAF9_UNCEI|nr:FAD:protein FMN transferase [Candidatus Eisenbacteria bacterium]